MARRREQCSVADGVSDALAELPVEDSLGSLALGDGGRLGAPVLVVGGQPSPCVGGIVLGGVELLGELVGLGDGGAEGGGGGGVFVCGIGAAGEDLTVGDSRCKLLLPLPAEVVMPADPGLQTVALQVGEDARVCGGG
jgi:hypothetical protein